MKQISEYLLSKKRNKFEGLLDKNYDDIYELVDDLNIYFGDELKKPIKVVDSDVVFRPIASYTRDGIHVKEHFVIEFTRTTTKLRFGNHGGELMMQEVFKDYKGNNTYGTLTRYKAYKYGENFLDWLNMLEKETKWKPAIKIFKDYKI